MDIETARLIHGGILAAGGIFWLFGLRAHRKAFAAAPADPREPDLLREGEEELPAAPAEARDRILTALRGGGLSGTGTVRLERADDRRIEGDLAPLLRRQAGTGSPIRFEIELTPGGRGTRARWALRGASSKGLRLASAIFVYVLGPAALAAAAWVMPTFVIPSENPAIRGQVAQTAQVVHFLWPPFLFSFVARRLADAVGTALGNLVRNAGF